MVRCWLLAVLALSAIPVNGILAETPAARALLGSFECRDTPLRSALALLRSQSGLEITLAAEVPEVPVTLSLRGAAPEDLLRILVRQAAHSVPGLRVAQMGARFSVYRAAGPPDPSRDASAHPLGPPSLTPPFLRKISVGFHDEGLRQALGRVFELAGAPFTVEPTVPNVPITVDLRHVTSWEGLRRILEIAQAQIGRDAGRIMLGQIGDVYLVALVPDAGSPVPGTSDRPINRITLKLNEVPLKLAAEALFRGSGYRYAFSVDPGERLVSLHLQDAPLEVALSRLEQEASRAGVRLTWTRQ